MGLLDQARLDTQRYTQDLEGFAVDIQIFSPGETTFDETFDKTFGIMAEIKGLHTKHHMDMNPETGERTNSKNAHVSFTEEQLTAMDYPIRNAAGEVELKDHLIKVKDSTGELIPYTIRNFYPDETLGLIVCILQDYQKAA